MAWVSMESCDFELVRALRPYVSNKANGLIETLLEVMGGESLSTGEKPSKFTLENETLMGLIEGHTRKAFFLFLILILLLASSNAFPTEPASEFPPSAPPDEPSPPAVPADT